MPGIWFQRRPLALWGPLVATVFVLLFARSMSRSFDLDEHQFVTPPLVLSREGLRPYVDYPYFHMPYLVYLYAAILWLSPYKLLLARVVCVVCATATAGTLFGVGWAQFADLGARRRWLIVGGLTATFLCSRLFTYASGWAWNHDAAVLAILVCYLAHRHGLRTGRPRYFVLSGLLLGLASGIRLTMAPALVPLAASLLIPMMGAKDKPWRSRLQALVCFGAGGALASLPAIALMWEAQDRFFFGNLTYASLYGAFAQSVHAGGTTLLGKIWEFFQSLLTDPGNLLIGGIAIFALVRSAPRWRCRSANDHLLLPAVLATLWVGALAPTQVQYQYNYVLLPFFVLVAFEAIAADAGDPERFERWRRVVGVGAAVTVLTGLPRWYWGVINLASPQAWVPVQIHAIGSWVDSQLPPGVRIMTIDPLLALEGGRNVYPQYATGRFVLLVGPFMSAADRRTFDMPWGDELTTLLARKPPGAFLYDVRLEGLVPDFLAYARSQGFRSIDSPDAAYRLWAAPAAGVTAR